MKSPFSHVRPTLDRLKEVLDYDPETGIFIRKLMLRRVSSSIGQRADTSTVHGRRVVVDAKSYRAHILAWLYMTGEWPNMMIDHQDGNPDNNIFSNLRLATHQQNVHNQKKSHKQSISGLLGVCFEKHTGKWSARIRVDGKSKYLGVFTTPEAAHERYLEAKSELHPFWSPT